MIFKKKSKKRVKLKYIYNSVTTKLARSLMPGQFAWQFAKTNNPINHKNLLASQKVGYPITTHPQLNSTNCEGLFSIKRYMNLRTILLFFKNPLVFKLKFLFETTNAGIISQTSKYFSFITSFLNSKFNLLDKYKLRYTNLLPHTSFSFSSSKKIFNLFTAHVFNENITPWYHHNIIRFMEYCSGKHVAFQFYPFMAQEITREFIARYKLWIPRMAYYERRLGHKFFLEEALHIMHLSFILRDPVLLCSWLKAMILRISFWKTRSIFRFLKYLMHTYFQHVFGEVGIKGLKIKLKGKISAAGNSRKRTILYRTGKTSHASVNLRVVSDFRTINTFTGVMGFQVWLFY